MVIRCTDHRMFYQAIRGDETRYYPVSRKMEAWGFDASCAIVGGFGVYDSSISSTYAVALYATLAEAQTHLPASQPDAPAPSTTSRPSTGRPRRRRKP